MLYAYAYLGVPGASRQLFHQAESSQQADGLHHLAADPKDLARIRAAIVGFRVQNAGRRNERYRNTAERLPPNLPHDHARLEPGPRTTSHPKQDSNTTPRQSTADARGEQ